MVFLNEMFLFFFCYSHVIIKKNIVLVINVKICVWGWRHKLFLVKVLVKAVAPSQNLIPSFAYGDVYNYTHHADDHCIKVELSRWKQYLCVDNNIMLRYRDLL